MTPRLRTHRGQALAVLQERSVAAGGLGQAGLEERVPEARHRLQLIGVVGIDPRPGPARRGAPKDLAGSSRATTLCPRGAQRTTPVEGRQRAAGQTFDPQQPLLRAQQTRMFRLGFSPVPIGGSVRKIGRANFSRHSGNFLKASEVGRR